jgi:hypothetical protein
MAGLFLTDLSIRLNAQKILSCRDYRRVVSPVVEYYLTSDNRTWQNDLYVMDLLIDHMLTLYLDSSDGSILKCSCLFEMIEEFINGKELKTNWRNQKIYFGYRVTHSLYKQKKMKEKPVTEFVMELKKIGMEPIDTLINHYLDPVFQDFELL